MTGTVVNVYSGSFCDLISCFMVFLSRYNSFDLLLANQRKFSPKIFAFKLQSSDSYTNFNFKPYGKVKIILT